MQLHLLTRLSEVEAIHSTKRVAWFYDREPLHSSEFWNMQELDFFVEAVTILDLIQAVLV
jgi:hypothetical protein